MKGQALYAQRAQTIKASLAATLYSAARVSRACGCWLNFDMFVVQYSVWRLQLDIVVLHAA